jgi:hypothetical protein
MDAKTLIALQGSIAKWEAIVADTGTDEGCSNDEYGAFCLAEDEENHERMHGYAGKELEFLKSLLPTADTEGVKP